MLKRGFALAAVALPLCMVGASASRAQLSGTDAAGALSQILGALQGGQAGGDASGSDQSSYVMDGGDQRPIVYENGEWGYHDRYGRWQRAPEAHRRYMEYYHPHGAGYRPGERFYHRPDEVRRGPEVHRPGEMGRPGERRPGLANGPHPGMPGHPGTVQVHNTAMPHPTVPHPTVPHPTGGTKLPSPPNKH